MTLPCSPDPAAWFLEKDGRQYRDEPVVSQLELEVVMLAAEADEADPDEAVKDAVDEKIRTNLIARRKAREACFDCKLRLECLDTRLTKFPGSDGIWGGYFPEDLKVLDDELKKRALRSASVGGPE